jgi:hypothetical protein
VISITKADIRGAARKGHMDCAFANAACRQFGIKRAFFFRSVALPTMLLSRHGRRNGLAMNVRQRQLDIDE